MRLVLQSVSSILLLVEERFCLHVQISNTTKFQCRSPYESNKAWYLRPTSLNSADSQSSDEIINQERIDITNLELHRPCITKSSESRHDFPGTVWYKDPTLFRTTKEQDPSSCECTWTEVDILNNHRSYPWMQTPGVVCWSPQICKLEPHIKGE